MTDQTSFRDLPKTAGYLAKLSKAQADQLYPIIVRWRQAHRHQSLLDWYRFTRWLFDMAGSASRDAWTPDEMAYADDLFTLAGLSYERSTEFMPSDLGCLPPLMCEVA